MLFNSVDNVCQRYEIKNKFLEELKWQILGLIVEVVLEPLEDEERLEVVPIKEETIVKAVITYDRFY